MSAEAAAKGCLYVLATPIGHLGDLTKRAGEVLESVDLVAAEDTRRTRKLLSHLGLKKELISYREQNREAAGRKILDALEEGRGVALVSDAGTPVVSDPGAELVCRAAGQGLTIIPIPGPSAVATALSVSGFGAERYTFAGFPPAKSKARREFLEELATRREPLVFFEAPHRLARSLADMRSVLGPRRAVLCRELTKLNEEIVRSDLDDLAVWSGENRVRGEMTLVVAGADKEPRPADRESILAAWQEAREKGLPPSRAAREVAVETGMSRSEVYRMGLDSEADRPADKGFRGGDDSVDQAPERQGMEDPPALSVSRKLTLTNSRGLHARSATRIIQVLQEFDCRAWFAKDGQVVEGDSILSLLTLNCPRGSVVEVSAQGPQAEPCLDKLGLLFARNFDEDSSFPWKLSPVPRPRPE